MATTIFFGNYEINSNRNGIELNNVEAQNAIEKDLYNRIFTPYSVVMYKSTNKVSTKGILRYSTYEISGLKNDEKLTVLKQLVFAFCMELITTSENNESYGFLLNANGTRFVADDGKEIKSGLSNTVKFNGFRDVTRLYIVNGEGKIKGHISFNDSMSLGETTLFPKRTPLKAALSKKALKPYIYTVAKASLEMSAYLVRLNNTVASYETETVTETAAKVDKPKRAAKVTETAAKVDKQTA